MTEMRSDRWDVRGEWRHPFAGVAALRLRAGITDYQHDETEEGQVATTFRNKAHDVRVELQHQPIAGWRGVLGVQTTQRKFSAEGEEAYVKPTETRRTSLFVLEEYQFRRRQMLLERELLEAKIAVLEGGRPLARRRWKP